MRVQRKLLAFVLFSTGMLSVWASTDKEEDFFVVESERIPFSLIPQYQATNSSPGAPGVVWVPQLEIYRVENSFLRVLGVLSKVDAERVHGPEYYAVVNEEHAAAGLDTAGNPAPGLPTRIVLTLAYLMPYDRPMSNQEWVRKVGNLNFMLFDDKAFQNGSRSQLLPKRPYQVELRNDMHTEIKTWAQEGNYFYAEGAESGIPKMRVSGIQPIASARKQNEAEKKKIKNFNDLRREFLQDDLPR